MQSAKKRSVLLRKYDEEDLTELVKLFYDTVHTVNLRDYSEAELKAWAPLYADLKRWNLILLQHWCVVAILDGVIVGFGDVDKKSGYLDHLFVRYDHQKEGIGTTICDELEQQINIDIITTNASITAKPFFEKRGYVTVKKQRVSLRGEQLVNYVMIKKL